MSSSLTNVLRHTKIIVITPEKHDKVMNQEKLATQN